MKYIRTKDEIREIAKRYNWDDITSKIFNVETDKKYRDLFNSAIVNIQEDYRKARVLEIIEEESGIDLLFFSKLLCALDKECVYVKVRKIKQYSGYSVDEETGEIERKVIARFSRYANGTRDWFFTISFTDISSVNHYLLKDYGKTWALTKDELL